MGSHDSNETGPCNPVWRYGFAGLDLASRFSLPELGAPLASIGRSTQTLLDIRGEGDAAPWDGPFQTLKRWPADEGGIELSATSDSLHFLLRFPRLADFLISAATPRLEICCRDHRPDDGRTLRHLLLDHVLPRALARTGRTLLHAGLIRQGETSVAVMGPSGAGKSTLCAAFGASDGELLSDDALVVAAEAGQVTVAPTYPSLRLWPQSVRHLFPDAPRPRPMADCTTKLRLEAPAACARGSVRLAAIVVLSREPAVTIEMSRMPPAAACMTLVANAFALDPADRSEACGRLEAARRIASIVPVYKFAYPRRFALLPELCRLIGTVAAGQGEGVVERRFGAQEWTQHRPSSPQGML